MPSFSKFCVTITKNTKDTSSYDGTRSVSITTETLLGGVLRQIERMPFNRVFAIFGQQANAKATYVLYLKDIDPIIPQDANVTWSMHGINYSGKVKLSQPLVQKLFGYDREVYIQSDNQ